MARAAPGVSFQGDIPRLGPAQLTVDSHHLKYAREGGIAPEIGYVRNVIIPQMTVGCLEEERLSGL